MGRPLKILSPKHRQGIRLITLGMTTDDAAAHIGIGPERMSSVYRSPLGQAYALHLERLADDYVARMLALGLTPQHIASAVGGGRDASRCKPPRKGTKTRPDFDARHRAIVEEQRAEREEREQRRNEARRAQLGDGSGGGDEEAATPPQGG